MFHHERSVGLAVVSSAVAVVVGPAFGAPEPSPFPLPSLRSLDLEIDLPGSVLDIHGFAACGPVVLTSPVFAARPGVGCDEAQGPLIPAFTLAETDSGATGCRWIAGWADLTARGVFGHVVDTTIADAASPWRRYAALGDA